MLKKIIAIVLVLIMSVGLLSACGPKEPEKIAGNVTIAVPLGEVNEITPVIDAFRVKYPDINVVIEPFEGESGPYLTQKAGENALPDVLWGDWTNFPYAVSQGYVRPIDDLFKADPESKYVSDSLLLPYTYGGKLYAVPDQIHAMMIAVNSDMFDELNIDKPSYNWTMDEFEAVMKAATTKTTSGAAKLEELDWVYSGWDNGTWTPAYDYQKQTFDFTGKWLPALNHMLELSAIPGLDVRMLRQNNEGKDYIAKFGETGLDDAHYTFKEGLSLLVPGASWESNWMRAQVKANWEYYPYPRPTKDSKAMTPVHVNHTYMMNTVKDVDAAWELLKWVSFGKDGNLAKTEIFSKRPADEQADGKLYFLFYFPSTSHPDVVKAFGENQYVTDGLKQVYANINNSFRCDLNKILPGYNLVFTDEVWDTIGKARNGQIAPAEAATKLDKLVNEAMKVQWEEFNKALKK